MYISVHQIESSLKPLSRLNPFFGTIFLAFKQAQIPVGRTAPLNFTQTVNDLLQEFYAPKGNDEQYFLPFSTSKTESRWRASRWGSTSGQRIAKDAFGDALEHAPGEWGWKDDYIKQLKRHLGATLIPAFDLAVWMFRDSEWRPEVEPVTLVEELLRKFHISEAERDQLFDLRIPIITKHWVQAEKPSQATLISMLDSSQVKWLESNWTLSRLQVSELGPALDFDYQPARRLNIITGDNSLGKTLILDCIWWALTGEFCEYPIIPSPETGKRKPQLAYEFQIGSSKRVSVKGQFDWSRQRWNHKRPRNHSSGLVVFARYDGSFAIWDPVRQHMASEDRSGSAERHLKLNRDQVWRGLKESVPHRPDQWLCNGLLRDWVTWQTSSLQRHRERFDALRACLQDLAPSTEEPIVPSEPKPFLHLLDQQDMPMLQTAYGRDVPIVHASAAIQRVVSLAYMLVWTWHQHLDLSGLVRQRPQRNLVLIVDEVEAHLHPRWQRVIVPALMKTITSLSPEIAVQMHLATHSPLVLASTETMFDEEIDDLHHLRLHEGRVYLDELPFVKRGTSDLWLLSDVFGLRQARNGPAEELIERAKLLQMESRPSPDSVRSVDTELKATLPDDDQFWTRWRYFALQHGVKQ